MKSEKNLKNAFAGESMANRRYLAYARKAEKEGFNNIARLFRAAAESETIHALNHLKAMDEIKSTAENLKSAIDGEIYEKEEMYPGFIKDAKAEGNIKAERTFKWAIEGEKVHAELYARAIKAVENNQDISLDVISVCDVCGYTVEGDAPEKCPVCGSINRFRVIE